MEITSFDTNLTLSRDLSSFESKIMQKDEILEIPRKFTSANVTRISSTLSATSREIDSNENSISKRLQLHRSNTTPFKLNSKFKPTVFIKYKNFQTKVEDSKEILELLKASIQEPMNFPPIVVEQLKKHEHDPYINNPDPNFWNIFDSREKKSIENILRDNLNKRIEDKKKAKKEEQRRETRGGSKHVKKESRSDAHRNQPVSLPVIKSYTPTKSGRKLPPIEIEESHVSVKNNNNNEVSTDNASSNKETINSKNDAIESIQIDTTQIPNQELNDNDKEKTEETVKELLIDSLDDIDKPGIFVTASFFFDSTNNANVEKNICHQKIDYQNEVHIFMSSFFLDSEVERSAILVKVIPELRTIFLTHGYELYYHDCHLGTNGVSDNQNLESLCLGLLNDSIEKSSPQHGIKFIVFFGQKYGLKNLPNKIEVEDFEDIQLELRFKQDKSRKFSKLIKKTFKITKENTFTDLFDETIEVVNSASTIRENLIPLTSSESIATKSAKKILKSLKSGTESIDKNQEIENSAKTKDTMRIGLATPGSVSESVKEIRRVTISEPPNAIDVQPIKNSNESAKDSRRVTIAAIPETELMEETTELSLVASTSAKSHRVTIAATTVAEEEDDELETASQKSRSRKRIFLPENSSFNSGRSENQDSIDRGNKSGRNEDISILNQWYEIEKSYNTQAYLLKPISTVLPDYNNKKDASKRDAAKSQWNQARKTLIKIFEKYGQNTVKLTLTPESEIENFLNYCKNNVKMIRNLKQLLVIERTICEHNINDTRDTLIHEYFDLIKHSYQNYQIDTNSTSQIKRLKGQIEDKVEDQTSNLEFVVNWNPSTNDAVPLGISPLHHREHLIYIERLCKQLKDQVLKSWDHVLKKKRSRKDDANIDFENEIKQHKLFFSNSCQKFLGSRSNVGKVLSYVNSLSTAPMVILGDTGSGKTCLLNECIEELKKNKDIQLVVRSLGKTQTSTNLRLFLKHLNEELDLIYSEFKIETVNDNLTMKNTFTNRISKASLNKQLIIILDGIESLRGEYAEEMINWIPKELPLYVHIVISLNPSDDKGVKLSNYMTKHFGKNNTLKIHPLLLQMQANEFIQEFIELSIKNKEFGDLNKDLIISLTSYLKEILKRSLSSLIPLFCKILFKYFEHVLLFKSFQQIYSDSSNSSTELFSSLNYKLVLERVYGMLERKYGDVLVKRALGYIGAFQYCGGITENELLDLLSLDEAVLSSINAELYIYKCVPEFYWIALKAALIDLNFLIEVHNPGGYRCILFKYAIYYETINDRYFQQRDKAPSYHKSIFNYYSNKHASIKVLQAIKQPVDQNLVDNGKNWKIANLRRLRLFAYHLSLSAPNVDMIKDEIFFNYIYLESKLKYMGYEALIDDLNIFLTSSAEFSLALQADAEIKFFMEFLELSMNSFNVIPTQLYSQLLGRLGQSIAVQKEEKKPSGEGEQKSAEAQLVFIKKLMSEGKKVVSSRNNNCFLPNSSFMIQPGQMSCDLLKGFLSNIAAMTCTTDGGKLLTFETNGLCKLWDLRAQKLLKTLYRIKDIVKHVRLGMGNLYVITITIENRINVWNIRTGEKLFSIYEYENEIPQIAIGGGQEGRYLVVNYGSRFITSWNLVDFKKIKTLDLENSEIEDQKGEEKKNDQKNSIEEKNCLSTKIIFSKTCYEDKIGYAYRGTSTAYLFDGKSGTVTNKYQTKFESGFLSALELTADYFVLLCRLTRTKGSDIYRIELHDIKKNLLARIIEGCCKDNLIDVCVNSAGSHLMGICYSDVTKTSEIAFWNLESEDHHHISVRSTSVSPNRIIATDLRYGVTSSVGHYDPNNDDEIETKLVKIWNLSARFGKPGGKYATADEDYIEGISILENENSNYALTRHFLNKRVAIWDLNTIGKDYEEPKTPKIIYQEGSLVTDKKITFKPTDIILTFKEDINLLYILTDKGTSASEGGESSPIFESISVYNLKEEKIEYKVLKTFICAYDTNEYLIVRNKQSKHHEHDIILIGLSETRNHFIINSVRTGHVMMRMKNRFREEKFQKRANEKPKKGNLSDKTSESDSDSEDDRETKNIEQFIFSADQSTIIAAYHSNFLCIFDIETLSHVQTLEDPSCLLLIYVSYLTSDGKYFIHHTYNDRTKISYITIWNCKTGKIKRKLKNEFGVVSLTMSDDASHVIYCKQNGEIKYWNPLQHNSTRRFTYDRLDRKLTFEEGTKTNLIKNATQVVVLSGKTYSLWDIQNMCLINVFTNDFYFPCCSLILNETALLFGHKTSNTPVVLRLPN